MPYSPVTWAYRDAITISKLNQIDNNNVWTAERRIFGCQLDASAANTCFVGMGKMEFGGMWLYRNSAISALHPSVAGDWEEGSNLLGTSTSIYIVAYNDSGNSFDVKFRNSGPAYSDTNDNVFALPKLYDKTGTTYFRYIGQISTTTASAIVNPVTYIPEVNKTTLTGYPDKSLVKAWASITVSGGTPTLADSYNVTSISDDGAGLVTITWATDFAGTNYCPVVTCLETTVGNILIVKVLTIAAGTTSFKVVNGGGFDVDPVAWYCIAIGDQ